MYDFGDIKNVICPFCGYQLPIVYDGNTTVKNLLVQCKGRHCRKSFNLKIKKGIQQNLVIDEQIVKDFKQVFGNDYEQHLLDKFGKYK